LNLLYLIGVGSRCARHKVCTENNSKCFLPHGEALTDSWGPGKRLLRVRKKKIEFQYFSDGDFPHTLTSICGDLFKCCKWQQWYKKKKKVTKHNRAHQKSLFRGPQTKANSGKSLAYKFPINFSCKNQATSHSHTGTSSSVHTRSVCLRVSSYYLINKY